jgi:hypothetical protein
MSIESSNGGHSAIVHMHLSFDGVSVRVAQLGPDFLLLESVTSHPPCDANITMRVDQSERSWNVRLPNGISSDSKRVVIAAAE